MLDLLMTVVFVAFAARCVWLVADIYLAVRDYNRQHPL